MQFTTATTADLIKIEKLWVEIFGDSPQFAHFAANLCRPEEIYLIKENNEIAAMVNAGVDLYAYNKKGFYIYGLATVPQFRNKGYAKQLMEYVEKKKFSEDYDFILTQPAGERLFEFYRNMGYDNTVYLRKAVIEIKRNIWATAEFDTITSTRFREMRSKYSEDEVVHFSKEGYEKFTEYVYTEGGSTALSKNAYCLYFENKEKIIVRDLFADSTPYALQLLQAVRERTGYESAQVLISDNSQLFLGEGTKEPVYLIRGLDEDVYVNLMFE